MFYATTSVRTYFRDGRKVYHRIGDSISEIVSPTDLDGILNNVSRYKEPKYWKTNNQV